MQPSFYVGKRLPTTYIVHNYNSMRPSVVPEGEIRNSGETENNNVQLLTMVTSLSQSADNTKM